jgi:hypothetical protein
LKTALETSVENQLEPFPIKSSILFLTSNRSKIISSKVAVSKNKIYGSKFSRVLGSTGEKNSSSNSYHWKLHSKRA